MAQWEYDVSSFTIEQVNAVREQLGLATEGAGPVMFCTDQGACVLSNIPNANTRAIVHLLNRKGTEGWQLAAATFRADEMICFWMRKLAD